MKKEMRTFVTAAALVGLAAAPMYLTAQTAPAPAPQAQEEHTHPATPDAASGGMRDGKMPGSMMQMMHDMQAQDAKLQAMVATMNAASGAEKVDAMAALLTALVAERPMMHQHMRHMMETTMMPGRGASNR